jgi:hypothetical protein
MCRMLWKLSPKAPHACPLLVSTSSREPINLAAVVQAASLDGTQVRLMRVSESSFRGEFSVRVPASIGLPSILERSVRRYGIQIW